MIKSTHHTVRRAIAGSLLGACVLLTSVAPVLAQSPDGSFSNPAHFMPRDGEVLYRTSCQACHMPAGQGASGAGVYPPLATNAKLRTARYPVFVVVNGQKGMPPFAEQMDDEQIAAVVNYVRTHFGNEFKDTVSADAVKAARR